MLFDWVIFVFNLCSLFSTQIIVNLFTFVSFVVKSESDVPRTSPREPAARCRLSSSYHHPSHTIGRWRAAIRPENTHSDLSTHSISRFFFFFFSEVRIVRRRYFVFLNSACPCRQLPTGWALYESRWFGWLHLAPCNRAPLTVPDLHHQSRTPFVFFLQVF